MIHPLFTTLLIIGCIFCLLLIIILPIIIKYIYLQKLWHRYCKSLLIILNISIFGYALITFIKNIFILYYKNYPGLSNNESYINIHHELLFLSDFFIESTRFSSFAISLERFVSTVLRKNYEKLNNNCITIILITIPIILGIILPVIGCNVKFLNQGCLIYCIGIDVSILFIAIYLFFYNKTLIKFKKNKEIGLSEKFQIKENIYLIRCIIPVTFINTSLNSALHIFLNIKNEVYTPSITTIFIYTSSLLTGYIIYIVWFCLQNHLIFKKKFVKITSILKIKKKPRKLPSIMLNGDKKIYPAAIKNMYGDVIKMEYDQKSYFNYFSKLW